MIPGPITSWSKSLLRCKSKPMVMDAAVADRTGLMKKKKDGPSRAMLRSILLSSTPCLGQRLWASRHDLLVIPRKSKGGDNRLSNPRR
jgi:hypothetical protein